MNEETAWFCGVISISIIVLGFVLGMNKIQEEHEYRMKMLESVTKPCAIVEIQKVKR